MARTYILRAFVCRCHDVFLWCYVCSILLRFRLDAFVEAGPSFNRPSIYRRYDSHTCYFSFFFSFCLFGDVAFSNFFLCRYRFLVLRDYVVRSFLPNGYFLPCDHGLDFLEIINRSINQSINRAYCLSSRNATLEKKQLATVINSSAVGLPSFAFFVRPFLSTVTNFTYTRATQIIYTWSWIIIFLELVPKKAKMDALRVRYPTFVGRNKGWARFTLRGKPTTTTTTTVCIVQYSTVQYWEILSIVELD